VRRKGNGLEIEPFAVRRGLAHCAERPKSHRPDTDSRLLTVEATISEPKNSGAAAQNVQSLFRWSRPTTRLSSEQVRLVPSWQSGWQGRE